MADIYKDPKIPIKVKLNDSFIISLESNPSTGFEWFAKYDSKKINLTKPKKFVLDSDQLVGGSGYEFFEFEAIEVSETEIEMLYKRSWEKTPIKIEKFKIKILD